MWVKFFVVTLFSLLSYIPAMKATQLPPGFVQFKIAENLDPTRIDISSDGQLFIADKGGRVLLVLNDEIQSDPVYTLNVDSFNDRGLLGIKTHPEYHTNGYLYLYYSVPNENHNRVIRVTIHDNIALPGSEQLIIDLDPLPGITHNGGDMTFDENCKLYITVGDGQFSPNGQNMSSLLGKVLRLNDDGSIPDDNPFYEIVEDKLKSIWALGVRNPFTIAMNKLTQQIYFNDVGSGFFEEINLLVKGANYGWAVGEGYLNNTAYEDPIFAYGRDFGCAIVGGTFNDATYLLFPQEYSGLYFFSDYCSGEIYMYSLSGDSLKGVFANGINRPLNLAFHPNGAMYYIERNGLPGGSTGANMTSENGILWKVVYTGNGEPVISVPPRSVLISESERVCFRVEAFGDQPLSFKWYENDTLIEDMNENEICLNDISIEKNGSEYFCIVSNNLGADTSKSARLNVTLNKRPIANIDSPDTNYLYSAGDTILLVGFVIDQEQGVLPEELYSWKIHFHHNSHTHPGLAKMGTDSFSFIIPNNGETDLDVFYRIHLSATDSGGLTGSNSMDIQPRLVSAMINSNPQGINFNLNGQQKCTPFNFTGVKGLKNDLIIPDKLVFPDSSSWVFSNWNFTGSGSSLSFYASDADITANYNEVTLDSICPTVLNVNSDKLGLTLTAQHQINLLGPLMISNSKIYGEEVYFFPFTEVITGGQLTIDTINCISYYLSQNECLE